MSTSVDDLVDGLRITAARLWMRSLRSVTTWRHGGREAVIPFVAAGRYRDGVSIEGAADVEVRRSPRRRRTVSAYRDGARIVVLMPARFTRAEEQKWVREMVGRITSREKVASVRGPRRNDAMLQARANELVDLYLDARTYPVSVRWVDTMSTRWASCTVEDATIRISSRMRVMPTWVLDYVLVHELAHLRVPGHGPKFWALVDRYPRTERARGYLDGISAAASLEPGFGAGSDEALG